MRGDIQLHVFNPASIRLSYAAFDKVDDDADCYYWNKRDAPCPACHSPAGGEVGHRREGRGRRRWRARPATPSIATAAAFVAVACYSASRFDTLVTFPGVGTAVVFPPYALLGPPIGQSPEDLAGLLPGGLVRSRAVAALTRARKLELELYANSD